MGTKARLAVIATWLIWSSTMCFSAEFSSMLETVVKDPVGPEFYIRGRNGFCVHARSFVSLTLMRTSDCERTWPEAETFTFHSDGTLRLMQLGKCVTAKTLTEGSVLEALPCPSSPTNATLWTALPEDRQIMHQSTGLVFSAINAEHAAQLTLEKNIYSAAQTWRLDKRPPIPTAQILGMEERCLLLSGDSHVWLGHCGTSNVEQLWFIYPDGTIRPRHDSSRCLSFENLSDRTVLVTTCGLSLTSERWVLTPKSNLLNEHTNTVLDVEHADPSRKRIIVFGAASTGTPANQKWKFIYTT